MSCVRDRLIVDHLPLVGYLVAQHRIGASRREGLASAAVRSLVDAADAFDTSAGVPFLPQARRLILAAISDELRDADQGAIGTPGRQREAEGVRDALAAALGRTPAVEEIATTMGVGAAAVAAGLGSPLRTIGDLDDPATCCASSALAVPEGDAGGAERIAVTREAVSALPPTLLRVVRALYFEHRPIAELVEELGATPSEISRWRAEALRLLRDAHRDRGAREAQPVPSLAPREAALPSSRPVTAP
ncbi:flagellar biosynthesis protein FliA [Microbacterium oryzae]|uniref:sigma-70 family RNA polymerase sigma factor n=1 Tax=Microbacterium oryzae TaxID=743009 RepID=UPI0025AF8B4E|nr:flagellar biosynthesis protein FliA [Microbacterium oryzae]MDN3309634.1 flagellar biosynthesis protein FliA [Microbacterium oryzae]